MKFRIIGKISDDSCGLIESSKDDFINFWRVFYRGTTYEDDVYFRFINTNKIIDDEDIKKAMAWKKGWIGNTGKSYDEFGSWTNSVKNIIKNLNFINDVKFKRKNVNLDDFLTFLRDSGIFPNTIRMKTFICHITKPLEWPIMDRFVWVGVNIVRGKSLENIREPTTKEHYKLYIEYFNQLASGCDTIMTRKRVESQKKYHDSFKV